MAENNKLDNHQQISYFIKLGDVFYKKRIDWALSYYERAYEIILSVYNENHA